MDGLYQQWYPNGQLHIHRQFDNGNEIENEYREWDPSGNIIMTKTVY